jgi:hypothetical protein
MDEWEIETRLRTKIGRSVSVTFDGHTEIVTVVSVDADGFVGQAQSSSMGDSTTEFWIAYKDVTAVGEPNDQS